MQELNVSWKCRFCFLALDLEWMLGTLKVVHYSVQIAMAMVFFFAIGSPPKPSKTVFPEERSGP
jgi:hypothetical protein